MRRCSCKESIKESLDPKAHLRVGAGLHLHECACSTDEFQVVLYVSTAPLKTSSKAESSGSDRLRITFCQMQRTLACIVIRHCLLMNGQ